jgi:hypothetical protein
MLRRLELIELENLMNDITVTTKRVEAMRVAQLSGIADGFGEDIGPVLRPLYPALRA